MLALGGSLHRQLVDVDPPTAIANLMFVPYYEVEIPSPCLLYAKEVNADLPGIVKYEVRRLNLQVGERHTIQMFYYYFLVSIELDFDDVATYYSTKSVDINAHEFLKERLIELVNLADYLILSESPEQVIQV